MPRLLLLDNFLPAVEPAERQRILRALLDPALPWTVVLAANDPAVLALCPRLALLHAGRLVADGPFEAVAPQLTS